MENTKPARNVDEYLRTLPIKVRVMLEKLRKVIKSTAPMAEEVISYRIPSYKYNGPLVFFAAYESHCSLFVVDKSILKIFSAELKPYDTSGTTIHFTPDHPLPVALVKNIVRTRIGQNEETFKAKKIRKAAPSKM